MRRIKTRMEMLNSLHLTKPEIQRLYDLNSADARDTFNKAMAKDRQELGDGRMLFDNKVRASSTRFVLGISEKDFDRMIANEKSGTALEK